MCVCLCECGGVLPCLFLCLSLCHPASCQFEEGPGVRGTKVSCVLLSSAEVTLWKPGRSSDLTLGAWRSLLQGPRCRPMQPSSRQTLRSL